MNNLKINSLSIQLFKFAQKAETEINGYRLETCQKSGTIYWKDDQGTIIYFNYNWEDCGSMFTGSISTEDGFNMELDSIKVSSCKTFDQFLADYLYEFTQITLDFCWN
jgi:hypothetical protein